jgi:hypothetical protein
MSEAIKMDVCVAFLINSNGALSYQHTSLQPEGTYSGNIPTMGVSTAPETAPAPAKQVMTAMSG